MRDPLKTPIATKHFMDCKPGERVDRSHETDKKRYQVYNVVSVKFAIVGKQVQTRV
jgi:hypothetical protein